MSNWDRPHIAFEVNVYAQQRSKACLHLLENVVGCAKRSVVYLVQKAIDLILVVPEVINECVMRFNWTERECSVMLQFEGDLEYQQRLVEKKKDNNSTYSCQDKRDCLKSNRNFIAELRRVEFWCKHGKPAGRLLLSQSVKHNRADSKVTEPVYLYNSN